MASNVATAPTASPLAFMTRLSPAVYTYRPAVPPQASSAPAASPQRRAPKLVILATWMGARDQHIAKYLAQYQALFPTSPILLLRSEPRHFMRARGNPAEFSPAAVFFRSIFPDVGTAGSASTSSSTTKDAAGEARQPELLIHAFSNGGAASLLHLRRALVDNPTAAATVSQLPPYALVLDSTPGTFRYGSAYRAFTTGLAGLARWLIAPLMHAVCAWYWFRHVLLGRGRSGPVAVVRAALNDEPSRRAEVRRTYVYGEGDRLVHWRDVESHAEEAARRGFAGVRTEKVEGGQHVAHVRVDPARYWRVVGETWDGVE